MRSRIQRLARPSIACDWTGHPFACTGLALLVGAYAVGHHGDPRATADIDIWVRRSPENARRDP